MPASTSARGYRRPDRRALILVVVVFAAAMVVAQGCQQSAVRITEQQAVATAERQVDFKPARTQVRLVRQGLDSRPYWAVSLSVPGDNGAYDELATVRIDANTGAVRAVNRQQPGS